MTQPLFTKSRVLFLLSGMTMGAGFILLLQHPIAGSLALLVLGLLLVGLWLDIWLLTDLAEAITGCVWHIIAYIGHQLASLPLQQEPSGGDKIAFWLGFVMTTSVLWLVQILTGSGA